MNDTVLRLVSLATLLRAARTRRHVAELALAQAAREEADAEARLNALVASVRTSEDYVSLERINQWLDARAETEETR